MKANGNSRKTNGMHNERTLCLSVSTRCRTVSLIGLCEVLRWSLKQTFDQKKGVRTTDGRGRYAFPVWSVSVTGTRVWIICSEICFHDSRNTDSKKNRCNFGELLDSRIALLFVRSVSRGVRVFADVFAKTMPGVRADLFVVCEQSPPRQPVILETVSVPGERSMDD